MSVTSAATLDKIAMLASMLNIIILCSLYGGCW